MSTGTKWTPGPWHIARYGDGDSLVICTAPEGDWRVCFMATPGDSPGAMQKIKADARLIAAAPELYDALEGVVRIADRNTAEFDAARAALAKAKGERP